MGVAREREDGAFRTRPPGPFGGNLDVRELCAGSRLYLPVFNYGALFSCGDGHAAQGDGEVCINGIECPLDVTLRFHLHKQQALAGPIVEASEAAAPDSSSDAWVVVETGTDLETAARAATGRMVDLLVSRWGFTGDSCVHPVRSVALKLRLSQVVNEPIHTVSAAPEQANPARKGAVSNLMIVNDPEVVAELAALYPRYEEALVNNDVDTLMKMFWAGPKRVMRFGAAENLYGPEELEGVPQSLAPQPTWRARSRGWTL